MPPALLIAALVNFLTGAMAFGLAMVVLWQDTHSRLNRLFGGFLLMLCANALFNTLLRFAPQFELDLGNLLRIASAFFVAAISALLLFNLEFVHDNDRRIRALQALVVVMAVGGGGYLLFGDWFSAPVITDSGHVSYHTSLLSKLLIGLTIVLLVLSAWLLWRSKKDGARDFFWPAALTPLGFSAFFVPFLEDVPMLTIVMIVVALLDTRVVLRLQLFDPLARLNKQLAATNATLNHTLQELAATNAALAEANQYQSAFMARMSHELRTPLNAIIGFSDLMQQELYGPLNEQQHTRLKSVLRSSQNLLGMIDDLLDLSKIKAGELHLNTTALAPNTALDEAVNMMEPLAANKNLVIKRGYGLLPAVKADPHRFQQIITNLLGNAIKYTKTGSITIGAEVDGNAIRFSVEDTGVGIPEDQLNAIFDEFRQIENPALADQPVQGVGLGLAIVKQLVEMHGGSIHVESRPGVGSTFTFTLPLADAPVSPQPEAPIIPESDADLRRAGAQT